MKRLFALIISVAALHGCDDGDLAFEEINFDDVAVERCSGFNTNKLYKVNANEALLLNIGNTESAFDLAFRESPTPAGQPILLPIAAASNIFVAYQRFDGTVTSETFCDPLPPIDPVAIEEWKAISGAVSITTTPDLDPNNTDGFEGGQKLSAFVHNIVFTNVEFDKGDGTTQLYPEFNFGGYRKTVSDAMAVPKTFSQVLDTCSTATRIFNVAGTHAMILDIDPLLLSEDTTNIKTGLINSTTNRFTYSVFGSAINKLTMLCTATPSPAPLHTWVADNGVAEGATFVSGYITVETDEISPGVFLHTIRLKKVTLKKDNIQFLLADDYLFGAIATE